MARRPAAADKAAFLAALAAAGRRVLMVGDGINDAPALAGLRFDVAVERGRHQPDRRRYRLHRQQARAGRPCAQVARAARRLILQNFALAIGYNLIAVPIAVLGYATPLIAAVAMSPRRSWSPPTRCGCRW
jgi:P-type Cu2+ transporter